MTLQSTNPYQQVNEEVYKKRVWAWTMYDWANSAFATTILAAVLPVYFSQVAGATLPSATVATTYWSTGLSISLLIIAILSPILGTISDVMRGKKRFLAIFVGIGILSTALLVFVSTGDWILASILGIIGRIGFNGANTFYDALLPHVAKEEDRDKISARGYAMGYLGGGLLLAVNIVMIQLLPGTWGPRLSFLSVAVWWAIFSIPLFRYVPEPPSAGIQRNDGEKIVSASFRRLKETLKDIRRYRELFKYLISFLIYNDGIGTIIGVAAIYGAELGFGSVELILALLLVQFVGIPYSLIFGRLPSVNDKRRPFFLAFILFNVIALPIVGVLGVNTLPANISGAPAAAFADTQNSVGEGNYLSTSSAIQFRGDWQDIVLPGEQVGRDIDYTLRSSNDLQGRIDFPFNGQQISISYSQGPEQGIWAVYLDDQPLQDPDTSTPLVIDAYNKTVRYEVLRTFQAEEPGEHILSLANTGEKNVESSDYRFTFEQANVLPALRQSNLGLIIGIIIAIEVVCLLLAWIFGKRFFSRLVETFDTRRSVLFALMIYGIVAIWGFFLDSVIEFWFMAWMVAIVQGGSQALSRSLYASMSPAAKSGEFFGLFGIMEKFSAIIGPLLFAAAGVIFGSSRPAVLSLIVLFALGGFLLTRVNIDEGKRVAKIEDAALLGDNP